MSPQFVDFNGDGHLDILTATFDGSPHVAYGSAAGFAQPERLKNTYGDRLIITSFWNYEDEAHQVDNRAMDFVTKGKERCVSALAFDWDDDGDHDLLLGSYENGHLYLQMNEGTNAVPEFTGKNIVVMAGAVPFAVKGKMTSPRLIDWDGDGDMDLLAGSFGDCSGKRTGGAVYLFRNVGKIGAPKFSAPYTLISASKKGQTEPTRPDAGLYVDALDFDKDGDLDLIVGGYSMWQRPARQLSQAEQAEADDLGKQVDALKAELSELSDTFFKEWSTATEGLDPESSEYEEAASPLTAALHKNRLAPTKKLKDLEAQLEDLVPSAQRKTFVWLYERQ